MRKRSLDGAVVVVTGASSGVGRASALAFADHGTRVVVAGRSGPDLEVVAEECRRRGAAAAVAVVYEAADASTVEHVAQVAVSAFGRIDVWVQAAAALVVGSLCQADLTDLERLVEVNVRGYLVAARVALAQFEQQQAGTLILVSSMLGILPSPAAPAYAMTKFGVRGLALSLRQSVITSPGIHVATVMPGPVDTPMFEHAANRTGHALRAVPPAYAPERVAATIVSCARRPRRQVTIGLTMRVVLALHHLSPRMTEAVIGQTSAHLLVRRKESPRSAGSLFEPPASGRVHGGWRRGRARRRAGEGLGRWLGRRGSLRHGEARERVDQLG